VFLPVKEESADEEVEKADATGSTASNGIKDDAAAEGM